MNKHTKLYQDYVVFVESKSLRGRSKEEYLRQVRKLAEYYPSRSLKQLTERQIFDYLIFRRDEQKLRPSTLNQAVVALRMFYRDFLQRDWQLWRQFEIRRDQPLPLVLTRDETRRLLRSIGWLSAAAGRTLRRVRFLLGCGPVIKPPLTTSPWLCPCCQKPMIFAGCIGPVRGPPLGRSALCFAARVHSRPTFQPVVSR